MQLFRQFDEKGYKSEEDPDFELPATESVKMKLAGELSESSTDDDDTITDEQVGMNEDEENMEEWKEFVKI